jgi:predicted ribosomally synthesized peptide with SipW-like signal peptide
MKKAFGLILAGFLITCLIAGTTAGAWALFQDTETSSNNQLTAGTMDLKLTDANESDQDSITASFGGSALVPGANIGPSTVTLKNTGNLNADHVDIKFQNTVTDNASYNANDLGPNITDMAMVLTVSALSYGGSNLLTQTVPGTFNNTYIEAADNAGNNDGIITLRELNNVIIQSLSAPPANNGTRVLSITLNIGANVGNGIQGDIDNVTVTFGLYQNTSQHLS